MIESLGLFSLSYYYYTLPDPAIGLKGTASFLALISLSVMYLG